MPTFQEPAWWSAKYQYKVVVVLSPCVAAVW